MQLAPGIRAALASLLLLGFLLAAWHLATLPPPAGQNADADYAALVGASKSGLPGPTQIAQAAWQQLKSPFRNGGMNDKGIAIHLAWSLGRVLLGFAIAALVAIPLGFFIGSSPFAYRALNPYIQVLKPISPLAWMPLALYTIKDSGTCSVFVIAICSVWPMLLNTAHGVGSVKRDWLDVARTLEVSPLRKGFQILLPAAAPTILTGMRISMGIAWLVIVAAEMLVGGTGIGYFVWNEWNNLSLANVIFALGVIGLVGMLLDLGFAGLGRLVAWQE